MRREENGGALSNAGTKFALQCTSRHITNRKIKMLINYTSDDKIFPAREAA